MLNIVRHGQPTDRPPLVIAHGLFGSARNWGVVAKRLGEGREVLAVDMRNHGDSPRDPDCSYRAMAADLAEVIAAEGGQADVLGHSMGGKAAMALSLADPGRVARLIVVDIAPVAYGHSQIDLVRAMQAVDLGRIARRSEADPMLAQAAPDASLRAFLLQSLVVEEGLARWKLDLEALGAGMAEIMGFPALEGRFEGPVLVIKGVESDYLRPEHWPLLEAHFPAARLHEIPGAGHWPHAEAPKPFVAAVDAFLAA
jgi:pimeloyl-ACP methyl ester carboxylesterase